MVRLRRSDPAGPGYTRLRSGRGFRYADAAGLAVREPELRERFAALAIPPAWTQVWICPQAHGHLQATGVDEAGRRQYLYHPQWRSRMDRAKFDRALELARVLPTARRAVTRDLSRPGLPRERVLAAAFRLLDSGGLRTGSPAYELEHGSVGLSTLRRSHVRIDDDMVQLTFPGKSGQRWSSQLRDAQLATVLGQLRGAGGRARLLAYQDGGTAHPVTPAEINDYVRQRTGGDFTAKDFRTLHGTITAARSLARLGPQRGVTARRRAIATAMREAAAELGNTPAVARASYVDPRILDRFASGRTLELAGAPESALRRLLDAD